MATREKAIKHNNIYIYTTTGEIVDGISLGTSGKSVDNQTVTPSEKRSARYRLQSLAAALLPQEQVAQCMHRCGSGGVAINVSQSSGIASFDGVVTCKSVWHCPVCSARITNQRRNELNTVLAWCRNMGCSPFLMTLTARHGMDDSLRSMLDGMKAAKKRLHQSREWRALDLIGHITATEVTYGQNGWHVHFHVLVLGASADVASGLDALADVWLRCLRGPKAKQGKKPPLRLDGNGHAYGVQGADAAGDYVTKWGAGEEVGLSGQKEGRKKESRTPWQLLADSALDARSGELFKEYAKEFKGRRQLVWSRDLKRLLGIIEKSDEEIMDEPEADDLVTVAIVSKRLWRLVVRRNLQAELLSVAEEGGAGYVDAWLHALANQERLKNHGVVG